MKKLMLLAIFAILVLGIGAGAAHAQAAESLPASQVLGPENASALRQTLTILGTVLGELNARVDAHNLPADPSDINNVLTGLHGALLSIHSTVASLESSAIAAHNGVPVASAAHQPSSESPLGVGTTPSYPSNGLVASASLAAGLQKFLWPTLIVLILVGGIFFLSRNAPAETPTTSRSNQEGNERPEEPETFSYLPTITDY